MAGVALRQLVALLIDQAVGKTMSEHRCPCDLHFRSDARRFLAGASGNILNTLLLESAHRSVGASTAVFAALGLVAGYVWRGKLVAQDRWPYRVGPIVGGLALLMYTGTGGENTDIGAHLMGFLCGFGGGMLLSSVRGRLLDANLQRVSGVIAGVIVCGAWIVALQP